MNKTQLIKAFLNAVNTWKSYVLALKNANKSGNKYAKSVLAKAVFYWVKECEKLKKMLDFAMFSR